MMHWLIIGIVLILLVFFYLKIEHQGRKIKMIFLIIIIAIVIASLTFVLSSEQINLSSPKGITKAIYFYVGWIGKTTADLWGIGTDFTGKVIEAVNITNNSGLSKPDKKLPPRK